MNDRARWRTSLHEAGHAVASIVFGGRALGVCLLSEGGGLCQSDELDRTRSAFMIASGAAAERLTAEYPVPDLKTDHTTVTVDEIENLSVFSSAPTLACQMVRSPDTRKHFDDDDRRLALWAIFGNESDPDSWARRVQFARHMAENLIERNALAIVRIATALFEKSSLSETEIKKLVDGAKS